MRSRYKFDIVPDQAYFITLSVVEMIPIFTNSTYINVLIKNFEFYRKEEGLKIFYYVIMDSNTHMIVSHKDDIGGIIRNLKSYAAKEMIKYLKNDSRKWMLHLMKHYKKSYKQKSEYQFWQEGSHPKLIHSVDMLEQKVDYIHFNPVKRGLVLEPDDWLYSSARNYSGKENMFEVDQIEV